MEFVWAVISLAGTGFLASIALGFASRRFHVEIDPRVEEIIEILPGANCGACGLPSGCAGCAKGIVEGTLECNICAPGGPETAQKIAEIMGAEIELGERKMAIVCCAGSRADVKTRFLYHGLEDCTAADIFQAGSGDKDCTYGCLGMGTCVRACPFDAIIITESQLAVVDPEKCTGCGNCVEVCPRNIIKMIPVSAPIASLCNSMEKGATVKSICAVGCTGCGICAKRAKEDAIHLENDLPVINYNVQPESLDVAELCPQFVIIDLKRYKPLDWLQGGRDRFKQEVKEKKKKAKKKKEDKSDSEDSD